MPMTKRKQSKQGRLTFKKRKHPTLGFQHNVTQFGDIKPSGSLSRLTADPNRIYRFVETIYFGITVTQSNLTDILGGASYTVNQLTNFSSASAIFDQYRIVLVEENWWPQFTANIGNALGAPAGADYGRFITVIDYDDASIPASTAVLAAYSTCKILQSTQTHKRKYVPHTAEGAYSGAFTSFSNKVGAWNDCASPAIQYYGLKYSLTKGQAGQTQLQQMYHAVRITVEYRMTH